MTHINNFMKSKVLSNIISKSYNMAKKVVRMLECTCEKCGHSWTSRIKDPKLCPKCKTAYWNEDRKPKQETQEN